MGFDSGIDWAARVVNASCQRCANIVKPAHFEVSHSSFRLGVISRMVQH